MKDKERMDRFASAQAQRLLGKLAFQIRRAAKHPDEDAIHDLRVAIRRFSQCLREFRAFFPKQENRKALKQLDRLMDLAGEMRNRDIAIELVGASERALATRLRAERGHAKSNLSVALTKWRSRDFSRKWRPWLEV